MLYFFLQTFGEVLHHPVVLLTGDVRYAVGIEPTADTLLLSYVSPSWVLEAMELPRELSFYQRFYFCLHSMSAANGGRHGNIQSIAEDCSLGIQQAVKALRIERIIERIPGAVGHLAARRGVVPL